MHWREIERDRERRDTSHLGKPYSELEGKRCMQRNAATLKILGLEPVRDTNWGTTGCESNSLGKGYRRIAMR